MTFIGKWAPRLGVAAAASSVLLAVCSPTAAAAPEADSRGYVDSTARCAPPSTVVEFGSTGDSRVAICTADGQYQYRGVRVRDGARLILPATRNEDGAFVAENDGIEYMVAAKSLIISEGREVIREEPWVDFHNGGGSSSSSSSPKTATPSTPPPPPLPAEEGGGG